MRIKMATKGWKRSAWAFQQSFFLQLSIECARGARFARPRKHESLRALEVMPISSRFNASVFSKQTFVT
uniref:Putative secreted protein n=1 Tax=Anopheles marajoara TaxID=58244 RepID=A0A2M4CEU9_9DIPT